MKKTLAGIIIISVMAYQWLWHEMAENGEKLQSVEMNYNGGSAIMA